MKPAIQDDASSAAALAIGAICREKNKVFVPTGTATSDLTGSACTPNYAARIAFQRDTTKFVEAAGGKVMGTSGAGSDLIDIVKQAHEFGVQTTMSLAALRAIAYDLWRPLSVMVGPDPTISCDFTRH